MNFGGHTDTGSFTVKILFQGKTTTNVPAITKTTMKSKLPSSGHCHWLASLSRLLIHVAYRYLGRCNESSR